MIPVRNRVEVLKAMWAPIFDSLAQQDAWVQERYGAIMAAQRDAQLAAAREEAWLIGCYPAVEQVLELGATMAILQRVYFGGWN